MIIIKSNKKVLGSDSMVRKRRRKRIKWNRVILTLILSISILSILGINNIKHFNSSTNKIKDKETVNETIIEE